MKSANASVPVGAAGIVPEFLGGETVPHNIVLACRKCNRCRGYRGKYQPIITHPPTRGTIRNA